MELSGDYVFEIPQDIVWEALQDPNVLGAVVPGGQGFEKIGENEYTGVLQIKVGPVQGTFQGKITLSDINPPESYRIEVDGKGAPGFVKATGSMHLESRSSQQTFMEYTGHAQVGGRIASVGQRLMESAARSIIRQSLDALNEYLKVKVAQQPISTSTSDTPNETPNDTGTAVGMDTVKDTPPTTTPTYKPPSQLSLAINVARDVLGDYIPLKYQPMVIGGVVVVIGLVIWFLASSR
jgi:carbon monoxide dehydrogenase subunit G